MTSAAVFTSMHDIRVAARALAKSPVYTLASVLTLAVAIGANAAIFSAVYNVLLKPAPIARASDLVIAWDSDQHLPVIELSYRQFEQWSSDVRVLSSAAAIGSTVWPAVLDTDRDAIRLALSGVSNGFFQTFGTSPLLGRVFEPADDAPGARRVVILSHGLWTRAFSRNPNIIGTTIRIDQDVTVVGVMPDGFDFPRGTDVWTPVVPILAASGTEWNSNALENVGVLFVVGRLAPGVTTGAAAAALEGLATGGTAKRFGTRVVVNGFVEYFFGPVRPALFALFAAVVVLLLIACANVSALMLARVGAKRMEDAVRVALGASRGALVRRWAVETGLLFASGGALGLAAGYWLLDAIVALSPPDVSRLSQVTINGPVVAFTIASIALTAGLCGIPVVRRAAAARLTDALSGVRSTDSKQAYRARSALVVLQVAFSLALIVASALIVRSFVKLRAIDLGFTPSRVISMAVEPRSIEQARVNAWMEELIARVRALPGVEAAGSVYLRPLALGPIGQETYVVLEGQPDDEATRRRNATLSYQVATPGYFDAMRIRLVKGRSFTAEDRRGQPRVALVSEGTARALWPGADPIGRRMLFPSFIRRDRVPIWRTVVGVVSDVTYRGITDVRLDVYDAAAQASVEATDLVVRVSGDPLRLVSAIQEQARQLDSRAVVDRVGTMESIVARETAAWRFSVWVLSLFGGIAMLLAGLGLFGLVSLDVAQRRREFAICLALGARPFEIMRAVLSAAAWRALAGVAAGLLLAAGATRGLQALLYGVTPFDASSYAFAIAAVVCVIALASYLPARRAAAIEPSALLRE